MDIGIGLPNTVPGVEGRVMLGWARRAEERGFSTLATLDRVAYPSYDSLPTLAAAAAATDRIGLMTNILLAPTRNAILLAKAAASVDQLSGGRLTLGLGVGGRQDDFVASERRFEDRGRRFDEDLELMHGAWRGESVGGCPRPPTPRPTNGRAVPVMIGGLSDRAVERVARWGIGWTAGGGSPDQVGPFAERVRAEWREAGRDGEPKIAALAYFSMGRGTEERSIENLLDYYGPDARPFAEAVPRGRDEVRRTVERFRTAGVGEVILFPTVPELSEVDLLADAVL
ncbi:MAG TPA: LLM class flavin-dependent oxidoreductase [Actinomycetota bacterium]|nr:LLM class flavin-dependent oxidoreductase [Actinomycetota bacterium]